MNAINPLYLIPILFPVTFGAIWLFVTTLLNLLSGWLTLQKRYPAGEADPEWLRLRAAVASMGLGVQLKGVLTLAACPAGLKMTIPRIFAPFGRPILVPWSEITVEPRKGLFGMLTRLRFGNPEVGRIAISPQIWEPLWAARSGIPPRI